MILDARARRRLVATALLALGVPVGAAVYVGSRTHALAEHLGAAAGVPARVGNVDADLTGTIRLSDVALGDLLSADAIEASVALDSLLSGQLGADELRVAGPHVQISVERDGDSDLARVIRKLARGRGGGGGGGGNGTKMRRIVVTSGALTAHVAGVGEITAEGVQLLPDETGVRLVTGPVRVSGASGRVAGELALERSAAEITLPHARFGRVLAVAGSGSVSIDGVRAVVLRDVAIGRLAAGGALELRANVDDGGARRALSISISPADLAVSVHADKVPLAPLAALAPKVVDLSSAHATGDLVVRESPQAFELRASGAVDDLRLDHRALGAQPITVSAHASGTLSVTADSISLTDATLGIDAAHLSASGWLRRGAPASGQVELRVEPALCADLMAALPGDLRGPLDGMTMTGTFGGRLRATVDLAAPPGEGVELATELANGCQVSIEPPAADVSALSGTTDQVFADGSRAKVGKEQPGWIGIYRLPWYVPGAFVSAEDARFYDHHGFDPVQIARSLEIDLRDHRLARGGSTISQQLIKNAFLTQRRSLDRKIQEAILTWRLESRLDKKTILERYLNIIELGPHIFGIGAAAHHWFDISPHDLTIRQAAFLAAMTSEPASMSYRVRHAGGLDPETAGRVDVILRAMRINGVIDNAELAAAREQAMHFSASALKRE
jgi:hypothetical protein